MRLRRRSSKWPTQHLSARPLHTGLRLIPMYYSKTEGTLTTPDSVIPERYQILVAVPLQPQIHIQKQVLHFLQIRRGKNILLSLALSPKHLPHHLLDSEAAKHHLPTSPVDPLWQKPKTKKSKESRPP